MTRVSVGKDDIQAAGVQRVDHDLCADGTVDDAGKLVLQLWDDKSWRNNDDASLPGHPGQVAYHILERVEGNTAVVLTRVQYCLHSWRLRSP